MDETKVYATTSRLSHEKAIRYAIGATLRQLADRIEQRPDTMLGRLDCPIPRILTVDAQVDGNDYHACITVTEEAAP